MTNLEKVEKIAYGVFGDKLGELQNRSKALSSSPEDEFLYVDGTDFHVAFIFDDIFKDSKDANVIHCMNLVFAEVEWSYRDIDIIKRKFPTFFNLQSEIQKIKDSVGESGGYVQIGGDYPTLGNNECSVVLKNIESFEKYTDKYKALLPMYEKFLDEVENYLNNNILFLITDTGIVDKNDEIGKASQLVMLKGDKNIYKIDIKKESFTTHAKLYIKDERGWTFLMGNNYKKSKRKGFGKDTFSGIIEELRSVAEIFEKPISRPKKKNKKSKKLSV